MATKTWAYLPITRALVQLEGILKPQNGWEFVNDKQIKFLNSFYGLTRDQLCLVPEVTGVADYDVNKVNQFLRDRGFDIQLDHIPLTLYSASVLDLLVKWKVAGEVTDLRAIDGKTYPAFTLQGDDHQPELYQYNIDLYGSAIPMVIAKIGTQNGDEICFAFPVPGLDLDSGFVDVFGEEVTLGNIPRNNGRDSIPLRGQYDLIVPMIKLDQQVDISWLLEMSTIDEKGGFWTISQTLQQTKFRLNEIGAHVESAVAVSAIYECVYVEPKKLIIDSPFFLWIERPGLTRPLFVGYFDYDCWQNPGGIE